MESELRELASKLSPDVRELMAKLIEYANSFIKKFDNRRPEMRETVGEFQEIANKVEKMQDVTNGVKAAGLGMMIGGLLAAPFTFGLSVAAAAAGTGAVVTANTVKILKEDGSAEKVQKLGREFMRIIEPLKNILEKIKTTCEQLEEKSLEAEAEKVLRGVRVLELVRQLKTMSDEALVAVKSVIDFFQNLLVMIGLILNPIPLLKEDKKFRDSIIQSGRQGQQVIDQFDQIKEILSK